MLLKGTTITTSLYTQQLDRVAEEVVKKRPNKGKIIIQHDNARPHTAKMTKKKLQALGWEVLPHPPDSPDLTPSDFHLFRKMAAELTNGHFDDEGEVEKWLTDFFARHTRTFWGKGIHALPYKWEQVILNNGEYIA